MNFTSFPTLITERLLLRQLKTDDAEDIRIIRSHPEVNRYIERPKTTTLADSLAFIEKINISIASHESLYWAISLKEQGQLTGTVCVFHFNEAENTAEIGYELHPDMQGKGIAQEAVAKVIDYISNNLQLNALVAWVQPGNIKSVQLLEKNNFKFTKFAEEKPEFAIYKLSLKN